MVNRIVKESKEGNVNALIKKFLFYNDEAEFKEIREYLERNRINYKSKRGLYYRLNKLIEDEILDKIEYNDASKYCLSGRGRKDPSTLGLMLKYEMIDQLEFFKIKLKQSDYWDFMTALIGFYSVYAEMLSWKLFKNEPLEKRIRSQNEFLREALPLKIFEGDWRQSIEIFGKDKVEKNVGKIATEFEKFSSTFEESNPLLFKICESVSNNVSNKIIRMSQHSS